MPDTSKKIKYELETSTKDDTGGKTEFGKSPKPHKRDRRITHQKIAKHFLVIDEYDAKYWSIEDQ